MIGGIGAASTAIGIAVVMLAIDVALKSKHAQGTAVPRDFAVEALDKMKDWSVWLTGLSLGAIGALGTQLGKSPQPPTIAHGAQVAASVAIAWLSASVAASTFLLCALPSLHLRLVESTSPENDIYAQPIYAQMSVRVLTIARLQHVYFLVGAGAFGAYFYQLL